VTKIFTTPDGRKVAVTGARVRHALTKSGAQVVIGQPRRVDGGLLAWEINGKGHAVSVFVPVEGSAA
jgi:hypothetical protein